ncbi:MAG TPA: tryptophan synthase subunit alpha [Gemmatimonadales bacterium]
MSDRAIARAFSAARVARRAALIPFFTAGWPTASGCREALRLAERIGAAVVEVGIPFSDPLADGLTIQQASQAVLERGMTVGGVFEIVREAALSVPVVLMTYLNPMLAYGVDRFLADAERAGVAGLLCTDLPAGAAPDIEEAVAASALDLIRLVAPTTPDDRMRMALTGASGFVYLISRLGVTGARADTPPDLERQVRRVRVVTTLPVVVGFGIGTPGQATAAARYADGVVVGSALVEALGAGGLPAAERLLSELVGALRVRGAA